MSFNTNDRSGSVFSVPKTVFTFTKIPLPKPREAVDEKLAEQLGRYMLERGLVEIERQVLVNEMGLYKEEVRMKASIVRPDRIKIAKEMEEDWHRVRFIRKQPNR